MGRYDLAFFLCCCKSFLGSVDDPGGETFYTLLGVDVDATAEELKKAFKRRSLELHPDKLAQRGKEVTPEDQERFTRMKEAYEILSDPHKRETYNALGEKGMKWLEEPFSVDPQQLAHNFAASSILDRSKIFAIFIGIAVAVFILPILVCLQVDSHLGPDAQWMAVLTPLWIWDSFILFYHSRVILMGVIERPDHIPEEEWVDPLPMSKRYFSFFRFLLVVVFELLAGLKLDDDVPWTWMAVFVPIYIWEGTTLYKKIPLARMRIVTVEDLEEALGKPFAEFTQAERELIARRYSVVSSPTSPEFEAAHKLKSRARQDCLKLMFRVIFLVVVIVNLDRGLDWNWWAVFSPIWILSFCICCGAIQGFRETISAAAERDPDTFGKKDGLSQDEFLGGSDEENPSVAAAGYGAMADGGDGTAAASGLGVGGLEASETRRQKCQTPLSVEEQEELKGHVMQSGHRMMSGICSQAFLLIIVFLFVGKLQGAGYSSVVIISPFLFVAGIILCCLGCTIFCITEIQEEDTPGYEQMSGAGIAPGSGDALDAEEGDNSSNTIYIPPPPASLEANSKKAESNVALQQSDHSAAFPSDSLGENQYTDAAPVTGAINSDIPVVDLLDDAPSPTSEVVPPLTDTTSPPSSNAVAPVSASATTEERKEKFTESAVHSSLHELD